MIVAAFVASMIGAFLGRVVAEWWIGDLQQPWSPLPPLSPPSGLPVPCPVCLMPLAVIDPLTLAPATAQPLEVCHADRPVGLAALDR